MNSKDRSKLNGIYYKKILETVENNDLRDYVNEYEQLKNPGNNLALNYQISGQKR